jgi:hypothetical protein
MVASLIAIKRQHVVCMTPPFITLSILIMYTRLLQLSLLICLFASMIQAVPVSIPNANNTTSTPLPHSIQQTKNITTPLPKDPIQQTKNMTIPLPQDPIQQIKNITTPLIKEPIQQIKNITTPLIKEPIQQIKNMTIPLPQEFIHQTNDASLPNSGKLNSIAGLNPVDIWKKIINFPHGRTFTSLIARPTNMYGPSA